MSRLFFTPRLICVSDVVADIEARIDLLAWVEDIFRVKDMLSFFEDFEHLFGEHFMEVWCANNTVVVLTTNVTLELYRGVVKGVSHFFYECRCGFVGEVQERVEVEVAITTMTMNRCGDVELFEELLNLHEELGEVFWRYRHVFKEGSWTLVLVLELREGVASSTDLPVHLGFDWIRDYARF